MTNEGRERDPGKSQLAQECNFYQQGSVIANSVFSQSIFPYSVSLVLVFPDSVFMDSVFVVSVFADYVFFPELILFINSVFIPNSTFNSEFDLPEFIVSLNVISLLRGPKDENEWENLD